MRAVDLMEYGVAMRKKVLAEEHPDRLASQLVSIMVLEDIYIPFA
jgi:hypothetical protein